MNEKLIIVNKTDLPMTDILSMASQVVSMGRESGDGTSYCYITTFHNGTVCFAKRNRKSDTLTFSNIEKYK